MQTARMKPYIPAKAALLSATDSFCAELAKENGSENAAGPIIQQLTETLESDRMIRAAARLGAGADESAEELEERAVADFRELLLLIQPSDELERKRPWSKGQSIRTVEANRSYSSNG